MPEKVYRPKAEFEGYALTVNLGDQKVLDVDKWPYSTEDPGEQAILDGREELTDRPDTSKKSAGNASDQSKGA